MGAVRLEVGKIAGFTPGGHFQVPCWFFVGIFRCYVYFFSEIWLVAPFWV